MSNCDLSIELDQSQPFHWSGEPVRGTVCLRATGPLNSRAVTLKSAWRTRGKGNVDAGESPLQTLHSGPIAAGQTLRLPFEINTPAWPPTYHGYLFSIEHSLVASVDIPWAFDPTTSVPLHVLPRPRSEQDLPAVPQPSTVGKLIGGGVMAAVLAGFAMFVGTAARLPMPVVLAAAAGLAAAAWGWFRWLPAWILGDVQCEVETQRLAAGDELVGYLSLHPRRPLNLKNINIQLSAQESCTSGSGSNQTTHNHTLHSQTVTLADRPAIPADQTTRLDFRLPLPPLAAYTLNHANNKLAWRVSIRIGLAGIPDWKKQLPLIVYPPHDPIRLVALQAPAVGDNGKQGQSSPPAGLPPANQPSPHQPLAEPFDAGHGRPEVTLDEAAHHLVSLASQPAQQQAVAEAMAGLSVALVARIDPRRPPTDATTDALWLNPEEVLVWASFPNPLLPLALAVARTQAHELREAESEHWHGQGEIVGWDSNNGRLQIRVEQ